MKKVMNSKKTAVNKKKRNIVMGKIIINALLNNTLIVATDLQGNVLASFSAGQMGFKGSKKSTQYAAKIVASATIEKAKEYGLQTAEVELIGPGIGREAALGALQGSNIVITSIKDLTYYPHNGCRPPKRRRQ